MQKQQPHQRSKPSESSDMTPMVDVVFLLLIFFVVTASFQLQKSLAMDSQPTDAPSPIVDLQTSESLQLQVHSDGTFILLDSVAQIETPSKQVLIGKLKDAIATVDAQTELVVKVQEDAVLQLLVDAMDAGSIAGFAEMQVTQVQEFH